MANLSRFSEKVWLDDDGSQALVVENLIGELFINGNSSWPAFSYRRILEDEYYLSEALFEPELHITRNSFISPSPTAYGKGNVSLWRRTMASWRWYDCPISLSSSFWIDCIVGKEFYCWNNESMRNTEQIRKSGHQSPYDCVIWHVIIAKASFKFKYGSYRWERLK